MNDASPIMGAALRNSRPFDPGRHCVGPGGAAMVEHVLDLIAANENRQRALRSRDAETRRRTVSALMANLAALAMNRVDGSRFLSVSFGRSDYSGSGLYAGSGLSVDAMTLARDALLGVGLVGGRVGRQVQDARAGAWGEDARQGARRHGFNIDRGLLGYVSRYRATPALRDLFETFDLGWRSIRVGGDVIVMRDPEPGAGAEPADVQDSRAVLARVNQRLAAAVITLPDDAWREFAGTRPTDHEDAIAHLAAGDGARVALRRQFKHGWGQGGRLFGGWWQNLPTAYRRRLLIDGDETVELDFGQLHPAMLYARLGLALAGDLYVVPPFDRRLGKVAFNHLLNRTSTIGRLPTQLPRDADRELLPAGTRYRAYLAEFLAQPLVAPVAQFFNSGEGLRLQREDSDLAVAVLDLLDRAGIPALPVHDSFIVAKQHADMLQAVMVARFRARYGQPVVVRAV